MLNIKSFSDKTLQKIIFTTSIGGTILVAFNSIPLQIIGMCWWVVADLVGTVMFWKKDMKILALQYFIYIWIAIFGLAQRIL